jgi:hydroxymethylpyrimidine/phosphomethylpyrimidine kinase
MQDKGINVLSLAGLDPTGGAGILADIKSFHQSKVNGFAVATALTYQTAHDFIGLKWNSWEEIIHQLNPLLKHYSITAVKVGLVQSLEQLNELLLAIRQANPSCNIIWDPVMKASAGFQFHTALQVEALKQTLKQVDVITPNREEIQQLMQALSMRNPSEITVFDTAVVVKGGHMLDDEQVVDELYQPKKEVVSISKFRLQGKEIHGSGCVFSSVMAAEIAKGETIEAAFRAANNYLYALLSEADSLLAKHHALTI